MELAAVDPSVVLLFGDVSVYLFKEFRERHPRRFFNMGICENTLISAGAGLSAQGFTPFIHTIAPFVTERCYEHIKLDLCYNRFPANIATCGASFDYAYDGATHHCYTDLEILRLLPNIEVFQPGSRKELALLLKARYRSGLTSYFRLSDYPHQIDLPVEFGRGVLISDKGAAVTVMTAGPILGNVLEAVSDLPVNLAYFHTIKPIDKELIEHWRHTEILVVQDAMGLAEAISEVPGLNLRRLGLDDRFCSCYGTVEDVRASIGLDPGSIRSFVQSRI